MNTASTYIDVTITMADNVANKVAIGVAWLGAARLSVRLIGLISTLILARLLVPLDFGLVALAASVLFVLDTLTDLRFENALIRDRQVTDPDLATAWTLNALRGIGLCLVMLLAAWPMAEIMNEPRLIATLAVLSLSPLIDGLRNPGFLRFEKGLNYKQEFRLQIIKKLSQFSVTIPLALMFQTHWALVAGMLTNAIAGVLITHLRSDFRPYICLTSWRKLFSFSGWLMASQAMGAINVRAAHFILGGFLGTTLVGIYQVGSELAVLATRELTQPIRRALLPALSAMQDDAAKHTQAYFESVQIVFTVAWPIGLGFALVSDPLVLLLLGENWTQVASVIQYIAPASAAATITASTDAFLTSHGRTRAIFNRSLVRALVGIPAVLFLTWQYGFEGLLWSSPALAALDMFINLHAASRDTGRPWWTPLLSTWRSLLASALMAAGVIYSLGTISPDTNSGLLLQLLLGVLCGGLIYATVLGLSWHLSGRPKGLETRILQLVSTRLARTGN